MKTNNVKKIIYILITVITVFLIGNSDVYAGACDDSQYACAVCTYTKDNFAAVRFILKSDGSFVSIDKNVDIRAKNANFTIKTDSISATNFVSDNKIICPSKIGYVSVSGGTAVQRGVTYNLSFTDTSSAMTLDPLSSTNGKNISDDSKPNAAGLTCTYNGGIKIWSNGEKIQVVSTGINVNLSSDISPSDFLNSKGDLKCPTLYTNCYQNQCGVSKESNWKNGSGEQKSVGEQDLTGKEIVEGKKENNQSTDTNIDSNFGTGADSTDCEGLIGPNVMDDIREIMNWIRIGIPIIIIILGSVDFSKAVIVSDDKALSQALSKLIKRLIAAVAIFFAPLILMYLLDSANQWADHINSGCDVRGLF